MDKRFKDYLVWIALGIVILILTGITISLFFVRSILGLFSLVLIIYLQSQLKKLLKTAVYDEDKAMIRVFVYFLRQKKASKNFITATIYKIFKGYATSELEKAVYEILDEKIDLAYETEKIRGLNTKLKFSVIRYLFQIATLKNYLSISDKNFIINVNNKIGFHKNTYYRMKTMFLMKGVVEEKLYQDNNHYSNKKNTTTNQDISKAYRILELKPGASQQEIKAAYRRLVKKHHPDKFASKGDEAMKQAEIKFQYINEAYELLSE